MSAKPLWRPGTRVEVAVAASDVGDVLVLATGQRGRVVEVWELPGPITRGEVRPRRAVLEVLPEGHGTVQLRPELL
jgi:hypothetical protein